VVQRGGVHQVRKLLKVLREQAVRAQLQVDRHAAPRTYPAPARGRPDHYGPVLRQHCNLADRKSAPQMHALTQLLRGAPPALTGFNAQLPRATASLGSQATPTSSGQQASHARHPGHHKQKLCITEEKQPHTRAEVIQSLQSGATGAAGKPRITGDADQLNAVGALLPMA